MKINGWSSISRSKQQRFSELLHWHTKEEFTICDDCKNPIENCTCVCPFCGERDKCECALKLSTDDSAATGG